LPPSGGSGRLVRCAVNDALSALVAPDSSDGARPPKVRRQVDSTRMSSTYRPSSRPLMSPSASPTTNASPDLSTYWLLRASACGSASGAMNAGPDAWVGGSGATCGACVVVASA